VTILWLYGSFQRLSVIVPLHPDLAGLEVRVSFLRIDVRYRAESRQRCIQISRLRMITSVAAQSSNITDKI
jgi:hypothetical protein